MYIRRKKAFQKLFQLIRAIEADQDDLLKVREFNRLLVTEILRAERAILRHRASQRDINRQLKTGRGSKKASASLRTKLKRVAGYISAQEDQIYIWRCFGDALAYVFLDKFSVKHAYFEVDRWGTKEAPGMLTGKVGLPGEISLLNEAIDRGIPAVLCDITNTLRYGDVCLLGAGDPYLIEVKSSPKLNQRGKRQRAKLEKLHGFLDTDSAMGFRGATGEMRRSVLDVPERNHVEAINSCIVQALGSGRCVMKPEPGVTYVAIAGDAGFDQSIFSGIESPPTVFMLNSDKNDHSWAPYLPFILTIRAENHLLDFIEGRVFLVVCIEGQVLCGLMQHDGWLVQYNPGHDYAIQCFHPPSRAFCGVSGQFFARAAYEFASLHWMAETHRGSLERMKAMQTDDDDPGDPVAHEQRLMEMFGADHEWLRLTA
jgi:hypothetical protein